MKSTSFLLASLSLIAVVTSAACTSQNLCSKQAQCLSEEEDIDLEADSTNVCVAEFDGQIAALRANEEDDCQKLADAEVALAACKAGLKCDDFFEADLGGECDDQLDDLDDARNDADGLTCTAQD